MKYQILKPLIVFTVGYNEYRNSNSKFESGIDLGGGVWRSIICPILLILVALTHDSNVRVVDE